MLAGIRRRLANTSDGLVMGLLIGFLAGALTVSLIAFSRGFRDFTGFSAWLEGFARNFGAEIFGAILTLILIDRLLTVSRRSVQEDPTAERVRELLRQMASRVNRQALRAADELRTAGWLDDGSLCGVDLRGANLKGARLGAAHMQGANLWSAALDGAHLRGATLTRADLAEATLEGAQLRGANLAGADLRGANLKGAELVGANLERATFWETVLPGADLSGAHLQGADLTEADLTGANLREATLAGVYLREADLEGADLRLADLMGANLAGATGVTRDQLRQAGDLRAATLPDGTTLPDDDTWREAYEAWLGTVTVDAEGFIVPAALGDAGGDG